MSCCPPGAAPYLAADHTDEGTVGETDGVSYYKVGTGKVGLLICPDIWGWNGGRTRAFADDFAKKFELSVWVPKVLPAYQGGTDDDGLPPDFNIGERMPEVPPLIQGDWHAKDVVPKVMKVVAAMKVSGVVKMGCIGVCYGGWIGMKLAKEVRFVCGASPHPSMHLEGMIGGNPAELAEASTCPWALFPCGEVGKEGSDPDIYEVGKPLYEALEKKFPGKNLTKRYSKRQHGFWTRGAIKASEFNAGTGDEVKASVQECTDDIVGFFRTCRLLTPAAMAMAAGPAGPVISTHQYSSTVVNARADAVFELVKTLKFKWMRTVASASNCEETGHVNIAYADHTVQTLHQLEISLLDNKVTWEVVASDPPSHCASQVHTIQVYRVTEGPGDRCFVTWNTDFSVDATLEVIEDAKWKKADSFEQLKAFFSS